MNKRVLIATVKSWNIENAVKMIDKFKEECEIRLITDKENLSILDTFKPDIIFFPHWSWKISKEIYESYPCIVFHTSNLPEGRGGTPLQNQIVMKSYDTYICAIKVSDGYDEGDIYLRREFDLRKGTIEDLLKEISNIIFSEMIPKIITEDLRPSPQKGKSTYYNRRTPEMSNIVKADLLELQDLYDFIRMLDGEGYPKAYIQINNIKIELSGVNRRNGTLTGRFEAYEEK